MTEARKLLDKYEEMENDAEQPEVVEAKKKRVVRGGKAKVVLDCPPGYKAKNGKCVKMTPQEMKARKIAGKKAARKSAGKRAAIAKKRARSLKKRVTSGL